MFCCLNAKELSRWCLNCNNIEGNEYEKKYKQYKKFRDLMEAIWFSPVKSRSVSMKTLPVRRVVSVY